MIAGYAPPRIVHGHLFNDVTNHTASGPIYNIEEAKVLAARRVISTSSSGYRYRREFDWREWAVDRTFRTRKGE